MMAIQGSVISHPFRADRRGTLATLSDRAAIVEQSIIAILETRQGERVMMPDYGIPDFVFDVADAGFAARFAYFAEQQIKNYEPLVDNVRVRAGALAQDLFIAGVGDDGRVAVEVSYTVRGSSVPRNLVFPLWQLRSDLIAA
jgi:phage baseplate assembly protein W